MLLSVFLVLFAEFERVADWDQRVKGMNPVALGQEVWSLILAQFAWFPVLDNH